MSGSTTTFPRIEDPRMVRGAQIVWIAVVALHWFIFLAALPYFWRGEAALTVYRLDNTLAPAIVIHIFWVGQILIGLFALAVGLFIFWKQPDNQVALVFSAALIIVTLNFFLPSLTVASQIDERWRVLGSFAIVTTMGSAMLVILTFPTGQFDFPWIRYLFVGYIGWEIFRGFLPLFLSTTSVQSAALVSVVFLLIGLVSLIWRYRTRLTPTERQQTKLVVLGIAYILSGFAIFMMTILLLGRSGLSGSQKATFGTVAALILVNGSTAVGIVLFALAILRRKLWSIDLVLNRSLVYGGLALVTATNFAVVALLARVVISDPNVALVVSVAAAGLLFQPVYKWSKQFVDRKLYRLNFQLDQLPEAHNLPPIIRPGALSGLTVGSYHVLDFIGQGGMGEVYRGYGENRTVAIKFLPREFAVDDLLRKRFEREARVLRALDHPNILHLYDSGTSTDGLHFLIIEYLDGCDLKNYIEEQGGWLTVAQIVPIVNQIAAALDYLHSKGLFHRDIKPSNVMIRPDGSAVLMDFGLVTGQSGDAALTGSAAIGTIMYMAPEQIQTADPIDHRADIYALGVVVYQMLTNSLPFGGQLAEVLFAHLNQPPPDPRRVVPGLSPGVAYVTSRALQKHPADRFSSAGEMARTLAATIA